MPHPLLVRPSARLVIIAYVLCTAGEVSAQRIAVNLGPAEPLPRQLYTFNADMATAIMFRGVGYDSPQFEQTVRELRPQGLRFPGGTLANNYPWKEDSFSPPTNDKTGWAGENLRLFRKIGKPYDVEGFSRAVRRNGVSPIWVLNVYDEIPDSVLALFEKLDSLGSKVTAVEMANEPYWDGRSLADVQKYIAAMFTSFIEHRDSIDIATFHAFYDARFGPFFIDDNSGKIETNASCELFRLLGTTFADADSLRPIEFATDDLRGFATQHESDIRLFVLNRGEKSRDVTLPELVDLAKDPSATGSLAKSTTDNDRSLLRLLIDCQPDRKLPLSTPLTQAAMVTDKTATLPAYSISLIGRRETLQFEPKSTENDNLFPRRPDLLFWYPPYASEQPRFDADGVYTVDLGKCAGKELAVVKMNLAASKLETGREYTVQFEAKASGDDSGLIFKLPQKGQEDGLYSVLARDFSPQRYTFKFDAATNDGEVTFVFLEEVIAKGPTIALRNFRIAAAD